VVDRPFALLPRDFYRAPDPAVSRRRAAGPTHTSPDWASPTVREYSRHHSQRNL